MKNLSTNAPVLVVTEENQDLVVYTDVRGTGLGAVLTQRGKVIVYASRHLRHMKLDIQPMWNQLW